MWKNCDVQPFLILPTVLDLRLLFRKLFTVGPYLLSLLDAGIALQGLITQVCSPAAPVCSLDSASCWPRASKEQRFTPPLRSVPQPRAAQASQLSAL